MRWVLVIAAAAGPSIGSAQIVKCVDPQTKAVTYSNTGCSAKDDSKLVARKQTREERIEERMQAIEARARLREEMADMRARQAEEARAAAAQRGGLVGIGGSTAGSTAAAAAGGRSCDRVLADLETRQSSIARRKTDNDVSQLAKVQAACGIDASKYMQKPPPVVTIRQGADDRPKRDVWRD